MSSDRPDTAESPPARSKESSWPPRPALAANMDPSPTPEKKSSWSPEAIVGAAALVLTVAGLIGHAFVVNDHVGQLERDRDAARVTHAAHEDRMRALEFKVEANAAAADKRESLIDNSLLGINAKLDALKESIDQLPHHH